MSQTKESPALGTTLSKKRVALHTLIITGGTIGLNVLAYLKILVMADFFGTSTDKAAYAFAVLLPSLIAAIMAGCANPTLVPIFSELLAKGKRDEAWNFAWTLTLSVAIFLAVVYAVLALFFRNTVVQFATSFSPEMETLATNLFYLAGPGMIFAAVSACLRAIIQCIERFAVFTISQIIGIFAGLIALIVLKPVWGVYAAAVAMAVTYVTEVLAFLPALIKEGAFKHFRFEGGSKGWLALSLFGTYLIGSAGLQLNNTVDKWIASTLAETDIAFIDFASRAHLMASALIGGGICTALLPLLSRQAGVKDSGGFDRSLSWNIRILAVLFYPYALVVWYLAPVLIAVFLQRGAFDQQSSMSVGAAWRWYALGSFVYVVGRPIMNAYYAKKKARLLVVLTLFSVALNISLNLWLSRKFGYIGLAMATSLAMSIFYVTVSAAYHVSGIGHLSWKSEIFPCLLKCLLAGIPVLWLCRVAANRISVLDTWAIRAGTLAVAGAVAMVAYGLLLLLFREKTVLAIWDHLRKRLNRSASH